MKAPIFLINWWTRTRHYFREWKEYLGDTQFKYFVKTYLRLIRQRRVTIGHSKVHPVWWDDAEWGKYTQVYVFMMEDYWKDTYFLANSQYFDDLVDFRVARRMIQLVMRTMFPGEQGETWDVMDVNVNPSPYFVVGVTADTMMVQVKLTETDLPLWSKYTVQKIDKLQ